MVYKWKEGSRYAVEAQVAGDTLDAIAKGNGGELPASAVVKSSRPVSAPLHRCFEWSNTKAARLYREEQARHLIRSIVVIEEKEDRGPVREILAYVAVRPEGKPTSYMTTARVMAAPALRSQAIADCLAQLRGIKRRFEHLTELGEIFAAIDKVSAAVSPPSGTEVA